MRSYWLIFMSLALLVATYSAANGAVTVRPVGLAFYSEGEDQESGLTLANDGDEDVGFRFRTARREPRRAAPSGWSPPRSAGRNSH